VKVARKVVSMAVLSAVWKVAEKAVLTVNQLVARMAVQ
jgi:hypothetical protein